MAEEPGRAALRQACLDAHLTRAELWLRYVGLGGTSTLWELGTYLSGEITPKATNYNLLVDALSECLSDRGLDSPVRYVPV